MCLKVMKSMTYFVHLYMHVSFTLKSLFKESFVNYFNVVIEPKLIKHVHDLINALNSEYNINVKY